MEYDAKCFRIKVNRFSNE